MSAKKSVKKKFGFVDDVYRQLTSTESKNAVDQAGVLSWSGRRFPKVSSAADEVMDPVEGTDFLLSVMVGSAAIEMTECLSFACPLPSDACDTCRFGGAKPLEVKERLSEDIPEDIRRLLVKFASCDWQPSPQIKSAQVSPSEARSDLYSLTPSRRGCRSRSELREAGRMGF